MRKHAAIVVIITALALILTACGRTGAPAPAPGGTGGGSSPPAVQPIKIRAANLYAKDTSFGKALDLFADEVNKKTNGKIQVQVFHNSELGGERDVAEQLKNGGVEVMITGLAGVGAFVQGYHILELPYLYDSMDQLVQVTKQLKPDLVKLGVAQGFHPIGFMFDGPRNTLSKKPLNSLADFKGLKYRVPGVPSYVEMTKALGAVPATIAYNEVYSALQTGTVDAMEGSADTVYQNRFYEQAKNYVLNKHVFQILYLVANDKWFMSQPPEIQKALEEAAQDASDLQVKLVNQVNQAAIDKMKAAGVNIIDIKDLTPFKEAVKAMNARLAAEKGPEGKAMLDKVYAVTRK